jgi:hypothetical protein
MTLHAEYAETLVAWYLAEARPYLDDAANDRLAQLDPAVVRLRSLCKMMEAELPICFLGSSGVGKSTLINAVVAGQDVILPAGGVGPLTAEATLVRYSDERLFRVDYHPRSKLNNVLFALERAHEKELARLGKQITSTSDVAEQLSEEELAEADLTASVEVDAPDARSSQDPDILGALARQAVHLIRGDQYASLEPAYTLDRLRDCLGIARRWNTEPAPEDLPRIARIKEVLIRARRKAGTVELKSSSGDLAFRVELQQHAAGYLAPLVRRIEVGWDAPALRSGVALIDLPGLGVANDQFRRVTAHWIRQARGVVLVVDRSGMSEASADLLRSSGFLNSLLHESNDPEDQGGATLLVAVVKLDSTAEDSRAAEKRVTPGGARPWVVHFDEACERAEVMIREQLATELEKVGELGGESTRNERAAVVRRVLEGMQVHPVVAPEYRKFLANDEDEPPRIKTVEQSRIPALARAFERLVYERNVRIDARIDFLARNVSERLRGVLELLLARGEHESAAQNEQAGRIRKELEQFAEPLRHEIINKQGEFREFLRSTVPLQIAARVDAAAADARSDIAKHLRRYRGYHWGTIRAAVRRGGIYEGSRTIDLPADLALLFEDPIAIVWSKHILQELRVRTARIGKEYVSILGELVEWSKQQGDAVDPKLLEALHRELQAEMQGLAGVGREAIDELKSLVKTELYQHLEKKVRQGCAKFVATGNDRGSGVKNRMLEMLDELADVVVAAARPVARELLTRYYRQVEEEIRAKFDKYRNPVDVAVRELIGESQTAAQRQCVERQVVIAKRAKALLVTLPVQQRAPATGQTNER